jgi:hypothetical protein
VGPVKDEALRSGEPRLVGGDDVLDAAVRYVLGPEQWFPADAIRRSDDG